MTVWVHVVDGEPTEVRMGKGVEDELLNDHAEELLKDKDWVADAVNELFSCCDLYERMKTEEGRKTVEDIIREQAKSEADDWLNDWHYDDEREWFEVEVTE